MELFQKKDAVDIYSLFLTKLSKIEALFLFGLYYSNNERFTEEEIDKSCLPDYLIHRARDIEKYMDKSRKVLFNLPDFEINTHDEQIAKTIKALVRKNQKIFLN